MLSYIALLCLVLFLSCNHWDIWGPLSIKRPFLFCFIRKDVAETNSFLVDLGTGASVNITFEASFGDLLIATLLSLLIGVQTLKFIFWVINRNKGDQ